MAHPEWIVRLFRTVDARDADGFASFLTDDASFVFANSEPVRGREAVREAVAGFFRSIAGLSHDLHATWVHPDAAVTHGRVTYTRHDGSELAVPFAVVLGLTGDRVRDYRIFMDASRLYPAV